MWKNVYASSLLLVSGLIFNEVFSLHMFETIIEP